MGPLVSAGQRDSVQRYVDGADGRVHRARAPDGAGFWLPPTVVLRRRHAPSRIWREEVFGPVVAVMPFDDEADAIALANDTEYGLSGSIFTRDLGRALRVARGVEAGNLSVNSHSSVRYWTPFGGYKQSGLGRELGPDAPHAFTEEKNVFIATTDGTESSDLHGRNAPWQDASRARSPSSPAAARASGWRPCAVRRGGRARSSSATSTTSAGTALVDELGGDVVRTCTST